MERQLASFALRRHIVALSLVVQHSCAGQAGDRGTHGGTLVGWARGRTPSSRRAQASRRHHRDASACLPPSGRRCLGQRFDSCVCHERRESTVASSIAVGWTAGGGGAAASLTTAGKKAGAAGGLPGWLRNLRVPSAQVDKEIIWRSFYSRYEQPVPDGGREGAPGQLGGAARASCGLRRRQAFTSPRKFSKIDTASSTTTPSCSP